MAKKRTKDPVVDFVVGLAISRIRPKKIILFGSRARGDARERSDYDLAFDVAKMDHGNWAGFALDVEEQAPTLKKLDLVRMDQVDEDFRKRILSEGVVVYAKKR